MKLILPNGTKIELVKELDHEQRKKVVEEILAEWNGYFTKYRNRKTQICLEVLSNYLCYEKKEKEKEQVAEMQVGENNG